MSPEGGSEPTPRNWSRPWVLLAAAATLLLIFGDLALLSLGTGFLTDGFNVASLDSFAKILAFLAVSVPLDLFLVLLCWSLLIPILVRVPLVPLQVYCLAGGLAVALPMGFAAANYNIYAVAGKMFNVALLSGLGNVSISSQIEQVIEDLPILWITTLPVLAVLATATLRNAGPLEKRLGLSMKTWLAPRSRKIWAAFVPAFLIASALYYTPGAMLDQLHYGLERKTSGIVLQNFIRLVTDVDRDGFGVVSRPIDRAPFDSAIHPYAVDHPGNGIDEDGLAGDLDPSFEPSGPIEGPAQPAGPFPHFLLIYLESFRADLIGMTFEGRPVTPFFNQLAADGASTDHAFTHSPWTLSSRDQLFTERIEKASGQSNLIEDFSRWGYRVGYFSGQDESYGDTAQFLGLDRADRFYDARQDIAKRTSRTTAPVGLQISWKTLLGRVEEYLAEAPMDRPHFLYVNIVDSHFPYRDDEMDDILGVPPLERHEIRADNARRVWEAYLNSVANVDRAAEALVRVWRERIANADHAIVVLSDHGEAFYEDGVLGHGQSVRPIESQIPLIVWGIGGDWPEPIGPSTSGVCCAAISPKSGAARGHGRASYPIISVESSSTSRMFAPPRPLRCGGISTRFTTISSVMPSVSRRPRGESRRS